MLAFWLAVRRCPALRPPASYEPADAPYIRCGKRRGHRGTHRSLFGLEW